jgi:hypothetical protein
MMMMMIKTELKVVGWEDMDCIYLTSNRDKWQISVKTDGNDPSHSIKCVEFLY